MMLKPRMPSHDAVETPGFTAEARRRGAGKANKHNFQDGQALTLHSHAKGFPGSIQNPFPSEAFSAPPRLRGKPAAFLGPVVLMALLLAGGCSREPSGTGSGSGHGHVHVAPHGGTAVVLGNEAYHLELVRDPVAGRIQAYVLDGHMESFIRIPAASFEITARFDGREEVLTFRPVANPATGETVGNTSLFEASADWLKTNSVFDGVLRELTIRGSRFSAVGFNFPKGNDVTVQ